MKEKTCECNFRGNFTFTSIQGLRFYIGSIRSTSRGLISEFPDCRTRYVEVAVSEEKIIRRSEQRRLELIDTVLACSSKFSETNSFQLGFFTEIKCKISTFIYLFGR